MSDSRPLRNSRPPNKDYPGENEAPRAGAKKARKGQKRTAAGAASAADPEVQVPDVVVAEQLETVQDTDITPDVAGVIPPHREPLHFHGPLGEGRGGPGSDGDAALQQRPRL